MSLWFAGTAVLPELAREWQAGLNVTSWLTLAVQLGFVTGALLSSVLNLSDVFSAPRLVAICAVLAAIANAVFAFAATESIAAAIVCRFLTGAMLAGVYPPGMKILSGWFREGRGFALGMMVGALGVGSALPHGLAALGAITAANWKWVVLACSAQALVGAAIVAFAIKEGPYAAPLQPFDIRQAAQILHNNRLALANFGYFGHMWELYSWWGWIAVMFAASAQAATVSLSPAQVETLAFIGMALGGPGCIWAGAVSDRAGSSDPATRIRQRSNVTIICMVASGASCLLTWLFFDNIYLVVAVAVIWGLSISADSAQFSAIISEVSDPRYVGTALTFQTAVGFLLTVFSIRVTAMIGERWGWDVAAASLAIGPALGILAMWRLKTEANR